MKVAVFSDVHGNLEALEAVVAHASAEDAGLYVCLGDIVGYGADPGACIQLIRSLPGIVCLKGNHDSAVVDERERAFFHEVALEGIRYAVAQLGSDELDYLAGLPYTYLDHPLFAAVHASPWEPQAWDYVLDQEAADRAFEAMGNHRLVFVGHSHAPALFTDDAEAMRLSPGDVISLSLSQRRCLINVGSVGQPRDGNPDGSYALLDVESETVHMHRVPYDREAAAEKILKAGLPPVLAERLLVGY